MPRTRRLPLIAGLIVAATIVCGCRALHRRASSDQAIAAARQLSLQGIDAQQRGDWQRAEALFAASIATCASDERAQCGYAETLWHRGARDEAVAHMREAVRLSGSDPERLVQLGEMHLAHGNPSQAVGQADAALAINRELAAAWALRGKVLEAQGQPADALASYHRALSYQRTIPDVQIAVARLYRQENRPQRALATLQALVSSLPAGQTPVAVYTEQGAALAALGRHHDAAATLAQAIQAGHGSTDLMMQLAREQYLAGELFGAKKSLAGILERNPLHPGALALQRQLDGSHATLATAMFDTATLPAATLPTTSEARPQSAALDRR